VSTLTDTEPTVRTRIVQRPAQAPAVARRGAVWPVLVVAGGLLASLAWSGLLAWISGRLIGIW